MRYIRQSFLTAITIFLMVLPFATSINSQEQAEPSRRYSYTEWRAVTWLPGRPLFISETEGSIFIRGKDTDEINLKGIKTAYAKTLDIARKNADLLKVHIESPVEKITVESLGGRVLSSAIRSYIDFAITLPQEISIDAETKTGDIYIEKMNSDISARSTDGKVTLIDDKGSSAVRTQGGDIEVRGCPEFIEAATKTGSIIFEIKPILNSPGVRLTTDDGNIEISFPENFPVTILASSKEGSIEFPEDLTVSGRDLKLDSQTGEFKESDKYENAGGGPEIVAATVKGNVVIKKLPKQMETKGKRFRDE